MMSPKDVLIESESRKLVMYGYNAGTPIAIPIYSTTVLCDNNVYLHVRTCTCISNSVQHSSL